MKSNFRIVAILVAGACFYSCSESSENEETSLNNDHKITYGIGGKSDVFYMSRAYPNGTIDLSKMLEGHQANQVHRMEKSSYGTWENIGPFNIAGRSKCVEFNPQNPNTIFTGTASGGLWRSYNLGVGVDSWENVPLNIGTNSISTVAIHPQDSNTLLLGTGEVYNYQYTGTGEAVWMTRGFPGVGIVKSTDYGQTWTSVLTNALDQALSVNIIKYNPDNPNTVYAGATDGVYRSYDGGDNWTQVSSNINVMDLIIHGSDTSQLLFSCGDLSSAGGGVYRSTDAGNNWSLVSGSFPSFQGKIMLGASPDNPDIVIASVGYPSGNDELFRSNDFGTNWNSYDAQFTYGWYAHDLEFVPGSTDDIVCAGQMVYKYKFSIQDLDRRSSWWIGYTQPSVGGPAGPNDYVHSDVHDIKFHPTIPGLVLFATDGGIYASTNNGGTFEVRSGGLVTTQFYSGTANSHQDSLLFVGGLQDNGTMLYRGTPDWEEVTGGDGAYCAINPDDDDYIYTSTYNLIVYYSDNNANSFNGTNIPGMSDDESAFISPFVVAKQDPDVLYGAANRVFKSTNKGMSWNTVSGMIDNGKTATALDVSHQNTDKIYVATCPLRQLATTTFLYDPPSRVFVSTNGGSSFTNVTANVPDRFITDLDIHPEDDNTVFVTLGGYGTDHVYKTEDGGTTWASLDNGQLPDVPFNSIELDPHNDSILYLGCDYGVYVSEDNGNTWQSMSDGLPDACIVMDLSISPVNNKLRIGTHGFGVYQNDLLGQPAPDVSVEEQNLLQLDVFPNPCTNLITVRGVSANGDLKLYSIKGQLVLSGKGNQLDVSNVSKGNYLLQVEVDGKVIGKQKLLKQ